MFVAKAGYRQYPVPAQIGWLASGIIFGQTPRTPAHVQSWNGAKGLMLSLEWRRVPREEIKRYARMAAPDGDLCEAGGRYAEL